MITTFALLLFHHVFLISIFYQPCLLQHLTLTLALLNHKGLSPLQSFTDASSVDGAGFLQVPSLMQAALTEPMR